MHKTKYPFYSFLLIAAFLASSCSNTKFLESDQQLYVGRGRVTIVDKKEVKEISRASEMVEEFTFVKPNNSLLGVKRNLPPFGLWTYNYRKPKEGKKGGWIYRNFNKPPVLVSTVNPELRCKHLQSALFSIGFFHAQVSYAVQPRKSNPRKAKIAYTIQLGKPFTIVKILTIPPADSIDVFINNYVSEMKLKPGDVFNLEVIKNEKQQISRQLIEKGYFFFGVGYLEFNADTVASPGQVHLMIRKSSDVPSYALLKYSVDQVNVVFPQTHADKRDSIFFQGISISGSQGYVKPSALRRSILFNRGDLYATSNHQATIKQLNNLGIFKYVKVQFTVSDSAEQKLNMIIELSTKDEVNVNLEGYIQAKSTDFTGPGMEVSLVHGNIGRVANKLQLKLTGGFEWQWGGKSSENLGTYSYNAGIVSAFVFPRLVIPFDFKGEKNLLASKTVCDVGFEFLNNVKYYRMTSFNAGFSYQWKKRKRITNIFSPVNINIVNLLETTKAFDDIADSNIYVSKSFEEQTILGMSYTFIYDNTAVKHNGIYFQSTIGTSGNLANLVSSLTGASKPYTILGNVYSQFVKLSEDIRYYTNTVKNGLVFRLYAGVGYSYGNSTVMPYIEQFYSGGSNSIRGFVARSLGPGSYRPLESNGIIDQTGDIKGEFNTEYRIPVSEMIHLAAFVDVGNVWLLNEDENRPGAAFYLNTFMQQLAVGSGLGVRLDFDFFVLRGDFGLPLRNTYRSDNGYWINDFNKSLAEYTFNIAIGYPF